VRGKNFNFAGVLNSTNEIPFLIALMQTVNDGMGIPCDQFVKNKY